MKKLISSKAEVVVSTKRTLTTGLFRDIVFKAAIFCSVTLCFYFAIRTQMIGFEIAKMTKFLNYVSNYSFTLKKY